GVYGIAAALAGQPAGVLGRVGSRVLFPTLSRMGDGPEQLEEAGRARAVFVRTGAVALAAMLPNGPLVIGALYDARYHAAGWLLQLLLVGSWFQVLEGANSSLLLARGDSRAMAAGNAL